MSKLEYALMIVLTAYVIKLIIEIWWTIVCYRFINQLVLAAYWALNAVQIIFVVEEMKHTGLWDRLTFDISALGVFVASFMVFSVPICYLLMRAKKFAKNTSIVWSFVQGFNIYEFLICLAYSSVAVYLGSVSSFLSVGGPLHAYLLRILFVRPAILSASELRFEHFLKSKRSND